MQEEQYEARGQRQGTRAEDRSHCDGQSFLFLCASTFLLTPPVLGHGPTEVFITRRASDAVLSIRWLVVFLFGENERTGSFG